MSSTNDPFKTAQQAFSRKMASLERDDTAPFVATPAEVRAGLPYAALEALTSELGLTQDVITHVLQVSERTLQRRRREGHLSPTESDRLWRVAHIYQVTVEAFEGRTAEARQWLTSPKRALGGDTPLRHLDTEAGERVVEQMLAVIEHTMPA